MTSDRIDPKRLTQRKSGDARPGRYVLYWMQQAQRATDNHALEYAIARANDLRLPVLAAFGLTSRFPDAKLRHYDFMVRGLAACAHALKTRGIRLAIIPKAPVQAIVPLLGDAALLVMDAGYTRTVRQWRERIAGKSPCPVVEVDSDCIVPVRHASDKQEFGAYTIRPKIHRQLEQFLVPCPKLTLQTQAPELPLDVETLAPDAEAILSRLRVSKSILPVPGFTAGEQAARTRLREFIARDLSVYADKNRDPASDRLSGLSPYLHFGQISPLTVALAVRAAAGDSAEAFLEQLIVRRELAVNYVWHNPDYDNFRGLPDWAKATLFTHRNDPRPTVYSAGRLENAETHDPYWNAAQIEMVETGKMHGYMRMYWGKKILEWSESPQDAYAVAQSLNDRFELDGRDPNGFVGVAWCFGTHDRPFVERPIFGKVRFMNDKGLKRKFDIEAYVTRVTR